MGSQIPQGGTPFGGGGMGGGNPLAQSIAQGVNFQPPPMALPQRPGMGMGAPQPQPQQPLDMDAITQQVLRYIYDNPGALSEMAGSNFFGTPIPSPMTSRGAPIGNTQPFTIFGKRPESRGEGGDGRTRGTSRSANPRDARPGRPF